MNIYNLSTTIVNFEKMGEILNVDIVEKKLGVALPSTLAEVLLRFGGPIAFDLSVGVRIKAPALCKLLSGEYALVEVLYGLNEGDDGLLSVNDQYSGRVSEQLVAIADAGEGDQFFWHIQTDQVFFWHHECSGGESSPEALTKVANTVEEFLESIEAMPVVEDTPSKAKYTPGAFRSLLDD